MRRETARVPRNCCRLCARFFVAWKRSIDRDTPDRHRLHLCVQFLSSRMDFHVILCRGFCVPCSRVLVCLVLSSCRVVCRVLVSRSLTQ